MIEFGPIEELMKDESVSEVMINGISGIYFEKGGVLSRSNSTFPDDNQIYKLIDNILKPLGKQISRETPYVDARLEDGSRVNIIVQPVSITGPMITIRKFSGKILNTENLITSNSLNRNMAEFLKVCVETRQNIIVSGGTGSGKTTLLNILSSFIHASERIITIEDTAELQLKQEHVGKLEARPADLQGNSAITVRQLLINTLRMRPDRIVVGECRGGEALDMLQAMNTGHSGSMTTAHANTPRDCLKRLEVMVMMAGYELPIRAIREQIASAVDIIVQAARLADGSRKIVNISEITGMEGDIITLSPLFEFKQNRIDTQSGKISGEFKATQNIPSFFEEIRAKGSTINMELFK
jgi:pilus assembly protein CpaF